MIRKCYFTPLDCAELFTYEKVASCSRNRRSIVIMCSAREGIWQQEQCTEEFVISGKSSGICICLLREIIIISVCRFAHL